MMANPATNRNGMGFRRTLTMSENVEVNLAYPCPRCMAEANVVNISSSHCLLIPLGSRDILRLPVVSAALYLLYCHCPSSGVTCYARSLQARARGFALGADMKEISLTKGQVALVDDADYDWLMQWKWCAHLNNQRFNLRLCTRSENRRNSLRQINNKSGYKGVDFNKHQRRWRAQLSLNKTFIHLGYFDSALDAAKAYDAAARHYYGPFASTNFPA